MTMLRQENTELIPDSIVNILLNKLELKFDRKVFCQILKIQAFFQHGTWLEDMTKMNDALARSQDFSEAKNRKKRLTASTKKPSQDVDVLNQL